MISHVEIDVVPLALAAVIYAVYRFVYSRVDSSSEASTCQSEQTLIQVDATNDGPALPEPCAEPDESEDESQQNVAAGRPKKAGVSGSMARWLIALFLVVFACLAISQAPDSMRQAAAKLMMPLLPASLAPSGQPLGSIHGSTATPSKLVTMKLARERVPVKKNGKLLYHKNAYVGSLNVGTPATSFRVVVDTGSGHLVLPSSYCRSETCRAHKRYKRSISTSAQDYDFDGNAVKQGAPRDQITVNFGTGEVVGVFIDDVFCLQDLLTPAQIAGPRQSSNNTKVSEGCSRIRFIAATEMSADPFSDFGFDGVLGLGLPALSQGPKFHFLDVMANSILSGTGGGGIFAMFLSEGPAEQSKITFGGWDQEVLGGHQLRWVPVLQPKHGHWMVKIVSIRVSEMNATESRTLPFCEGGGCRAVVDTGTSVLSVPTAAFSDMFIALKHDVPPSGECIRDDGPLLHFDIDAGRSDASGELGELGVNRITLTLTPRDFARLDGPKKGSKAPQISTKEAGCKPMMMAMDLPAPLGPKLFILGEPILRRFYTVFDSEAKRIGFGPARGREHWKTL